MQDFSHIKEWILPLADKKGISLERLGRAAGISRASVYHYMSDRSRPDSQTMMRICDALGVPHEEGLAQYTPRKEGRPKGYRP